MAAARARCVRDEILPPPFAAWNLFGRTVFDAHGGGDVWPATRTCQRKNNFPPLKSSRVSHPIQPASPPLHYFLPQKVFKAVSKEVHKEGH